MTSLIIEGRNVHEVGSTHVTFTVTRYEDDAGELVYMAWLPGSMSVGISDSVFDAIRELCDNLDVVESEGEADA